MAERLRFESELNDLGLHEYDQGQSSQKPREVVVGERVVLDLDKTSFAGKVDRVRWVIPGTVVRNYSGKTSDAMMFKLAGADLERPKISFFWVDAADGRVVIADIVLKSGIGVPYVVAFNVKGPKLNHFTAVTGVTRIEKRAGLTAMRLGNLRRTKGIEWDWKITMPPNRAGFVKDVQTVRHDRVKILHGKAGTDARRFVYRHPVKTDTHEQLDGTDGGEPAYRGGLHTVKTEAGKSITRNDISDSPHTELERIGKTLTVNDQFVYFLMYKPEPAPGQTKDDTIWVPVAKAAWSWKAVARNAGGRWTVVPAKMKPVFHKATTAFPIYESNAAENQWQEVSP